MINGENSMKDFFKKSKYLWIGGIMGFAQQLLGRLDYYLYHGRDIFSFSAIMGSLSLYAAIILFVMKREAPPKQQFKDLFLYFLGLDFFYYIYIFILDIITYFTNNNHSEKLSFYFQQSKGEAFDFIKWTVIGTAAGIWAYVAAKSRDKGRKKIYWIMTVPLFGVMTAELVTYSISMYKYIAEQYKISHGLMNAEDWRHGCAIADLLTALVSLIICVYFFFIKKKKAEKAE